MADYEAKRNNDGPTEHDHQNAKNTVRTVAKGAGIYFGGSAGGKAVDIASKTKVGDKIIDTGAKALEKNKKVRNLNNKLNDSGAMKAAETAIDASSGSAGGMAGNAAGGAASKVAGGAGSKAASGAGGKAAGGAASNTASKGGKLPNETPNQVKSNNNNNAGGENTSSLPSSNAKNQNNNTQSNNKKDKDDKDDSSIGGSKKRQEQQESTSENEQGEEKESLLKRFLIASLIIKVAIFVLFPLLLLILIIVLAISSVATNFSAFEDAFGISQTSGESTGNYNFKAKNKMQQEFYDRVESVKKTYQSNGKSVDTLKIASVYHVLKKNGANINYDSMDNAAIEEIANSMFDSSGYNESIFKNNLTTKIIPKYIPNATQTQKEKIADEIFEYMDDYHDLIHEKSTENFGSTECVGNGTCTYDIKGYILDGQKSYSHNIQVKNLYVRLMQCGIGNGHNYGGHYGKPLEGESLVPFEKYILGVTYNALGEDAPREAIKAHMVAARSFILARPVDKGSWRTLKQESADKWVIQVASCTQDQVYCDPDLGCSGKDAQWSQVYSGQGHNQGFSKPPLDSKSKMRAYATQTQGELLVNDKEYIVYSKYTQNEIDQFISLAKSGLDYKQILLQVYNQSNRNYKANDIYQASCAMDYSNCLPSTGDFSTWKQYSGPWINTPVGDSGKTIRQIGCLATSISILIAKSGVPTNVSNFNPGTFVEFLNQNGGFAAGGNLLWYPVSKAAPTFKFQDKISVAGMNRKEKLNTIKQLVNQKGVYAAAEVKGNTGQHWVAIDSVNGDTINMMDPGSVSTDMWSEYNWANTSTIAYFKVG